MASESQQRRYGGKTVEERRAQRRRALIDAAKELWRDRGLAAVTVRGVTSHAKLTDRYFYEQFADQGQLLTAVIDDSVEAPIAAMLTAGAAEPEGAPPAVRLSAGLAAFIDHAEQDPLLARIFFSDSRYLPEVSDRTRVIEHRVAAAILYALNPKGEATEEQFDAALFCVGGVYTLMHERLINPDGKTSRQFAEQAVDWCLKIIGSVAPQGD
jgi:AcrR family transcriptional regulator